MADEVKILLTADAGGLAHGTKAAEKAVTGLDGKVRDANGRFVKGAGAAGAATKKLADDVGVAKKATEGLGDSSTDSFRQYQKGAEAAAQATRRIGTESRKVGTRGAFIDKAAPAALNKVTGILAGGAVLLAAKQTMDFNAQLTQMGVNARDTSGKLNGMDFGQGLATLKGQIMAVSQETGQAPEALLDGMNAIVERTGNLDLATKSLGLMAKTAVATGAQMGDVGALVSNLGEKAGVGPEAMTKALETLVQQGKAGAFTMKDLATEGEGLFSVFPQFGKKGEAGLRSFGAFVQMAKKGSGSASEASTSIAALAAEMADMGLLQTKLQKAGIHGVKFLDSKGEKRAAEDIIKDIVIAANGSADAISVAFGESARKTVLQLANEYKAGNGFAMFESFKSADGGGVIDKDAATMLSTTAIQLQKVQEQVRTFSDGIMTGPLNEITKFMTFVNEHSAATQLAFKVMTAGALGLGGAVAAIKMKEFAGWMKDSLSPGKTPQAGSGKGLPGAGVQQVAVTNWPGNMGGGSSYYDDLPSSSKPTAAEPNAPAKPRGRVGRLYDSIKGKVAPTRMGKVLGSAAKYGSKGLPALKFLAKSGVGVGTAMGALDMAMNGGFTGENVAGLVGSSVGGLAGMIGGAGLASIPLGMAGGYAGDVVGRSIYNSLFNSSPEAKNYHQDNWKPFTEQPILAPQGPMMSPINMGLNINIDKDGRSTTTITGRNADSVNLRPSVLMPAWGST